MEIKDFLVAAQKMCNAHDILCKGCELGEKRHKENLSCNEFQRKYPEEYIEIVKKWAKEHPVKTKKQKFLELFNADTPRKWHKDCEKTCNANVPCSFCLWWDEEYEELK